MSKLKTNFFLKRWHGGQSFAEFLFVCNSMTKGACVCAKVLQLCLTLWHPMDWSSPGSSPRDSPGENPGAACHPLFQGIFLTQGLNLLLFNFWHWEAGSLPLAPPGKPSLEGGTESMSLKKQELTAPFSYTVSSRLLISHFYSSTKTFPWILWETDLFTECSRALRVRMCDSLF